MLFVVAAALGAIFVVFEGVIAPIAEWRENAAERAEQAANGYRLVARAVAAAPATEVKGAQTAKPARNALIETARTLSVSLTFVNEHADGSIEFQAGPLAPEQAFELFSTLQRQFAINVIAADIARSSDAPASVRLQATLSR